jgi:hypothetical protein
MGRPIGWRAAPVVEREGYFIAGVPKPHSEPEYVTVAGGVVWELTAVRPLGFDWWLPIAMAKVRAFPLN